MSRQLQMKHTTSLYLDLLRIVAAAGVFLGHADSPRFSANVLPISYLAHGLHELVIVFFFLSGYVMANATLRADCDFRHYAAARLSRLYSVVAPALVLTAGLYCLGRMINPECYAEFDRGHDGLRLILAALFLQENWLLSASPPTNTPLWSLGYEFWYYVIFGCWVFAPTRFARAGLLLVAVLLVGPKILLLFPVWLLGVACWQIRDRVPMPRTMARVGFVVSTLVAWHLFSTSWRYPGGDVVAAPWFFSMWFVSDWILGGVIFLNVFLFERAFPVASIPRWVDGSLRNGAAVTFSLYAFHYPMLIFVGAVIPYDKTHAAEVLLALTAVFVAIVGLQRITEARRRGLQRMIANFFQGRPPQYARSGAR